MRIHRRGPLVAGIALLLAGPVSGAIIQTLARSGSSERSEPRGRGDLLYQVYCLTCHGESGKGDGEMASVLNIAPANLRRISARNGGAFPAREVRRVIDGRKRVAGHGRKDMPLWGFAFQDLDGDLTEEKEVRAKIDALVDFLEALQEPPGTQGEPEKGGGK